MAEGGEAPRCYDCVQLVARLRESEDRVGVLQNQVRWLGNALEEMRNHAWAMLRVPVPTFSSPSSPRVPNSPAGVMLFGGVAEESAPLALPVGGGSSAPVSADSILVERVSEEEGGGGVMVVMNPDAPGTIVAEYSLDQGSGLLKPTFGHMYIAPAADSASVLLEEGGAGVSAPSVLMEREVCEISDGRAAVETEADILSELLAQLPQPSPSLGSNVAGPISPVVVGDSSTVVVPPFEPQVTYDDSSSVAAVAGTNVVIGAGTSSAPGFIKQCVLCGYVERNRNFMRHMRRVHPERRINRVDRLTYPLHYSISTRVPYAVCPEANRPPQSDIVGVSNVDFNFLRY